jgi:pimeloyl-ACP methyl ester carboxylesterase
MTPSMYRTYEGRREVEDRYRTLLAECPVPLHSRMVESGDRRTHVIEAGVQEGPPLVLLHGSASNSATWLGDIPVWSETFRVIALDIPGHPGLSDGPPVPFEPGAGTAWMGAVLDAMDLRTVRLVGMSLGGWVSLEFAASHPERVAAMTLLSPGGIAPPRMSFVFKAIPLALIGDRGSDRVQRMVFGPVPVPDDVCEFGRLVSRHYRPITKPVPVLSDEELQRVTMPLQVFHGEHDALQRSAQSAERLARLLPNATVRLLPDRGHAIVGQTVAIAEFHTAVGTVL